MGGQGLEDGFQLVHEVPGVGSLFGCPSADDWPGGLGGRFWASSYHLLLIINDWMSLVIKYQIGLWNKVG